MADIKRRETQYAVMHPDIYSGKTCDQVKPQWSGAAEGDKNGYEYIDHTITLSAKTFPPGTRVSIHEPECPKCGQCRERNYPDDGFEARCDCGFDWDLWVQEQFA